VRPWRWRPPKRLATKLAAELAAKEAALRELQLAKEAADAANRAKSEFLASMSHELRTPLNSIIGFSEILHDQRFGPLNQRQARHVENVLSSGRHLLQLVNDVLDLAKVESGRMELRLTSIDLAETLAEAVAIVQALADAKETDIEVSLPAIRPGLVADQGKLRQVLYNLLSNAVKFTPQGGRVRIEAQVQVPVRPEHRPGPGLPPRTDARPGELLVSVADTGIGVPEPDQRRIFDPFAQAESPLSRVNPGTGLGLALTRKLVELHGGRIWVESAGTGKGSCFRFALPLVPPSAMPQAAGGGEEPPDAAAAKPGRSGGEAELAGQAGRGGAAGRPSRRALRGVQEMAPLILVADNDLDAREIIRLCLRHGGYDVVEAADGEQTLAFARALRPQVITLEILLPKRDGWQVLAALREDPATRGIPVVVVSVAEERQRAHSLGARAFLVKPIDRELLVAMVRELSGIEVASAP
jgi:signal transduction histidine kinase/ActR/RegA family two-component response regulator